MKFDWVYLISDAMVCRTINLNENQKTWNGTFKAYEEHMHTLFEFEQLRIKYQGKTNIWNLIYRNFVICLSLTLFKILLEKLCIWWIKLSIFLHKNNHLFFNSGFCVFLTTALLHISPKMQNIAATTPQPPNSKVLWMESHFPKIPYTHCPVE